VSGHAARLEWTSDGSKLVVLEDTSIAVLDGATLKRVGMPIDPDGFRPSYIHSYYRPPHFALVADGRSLVTASDAGELVWWELGTGRKLSTYRIPTGYHAVAVSSDGRLAVVGIEGGITLIDLLSGKERSATAGFSGSPNSLVFAADGETVVSANPDFSLTRWDVSAARSLETLRGHSSAVRQAVFDRDGTTLYTVGDDGTAIAWDVAGEHRVKRTFRFTHDRDFDEGYDGHPGSFRPDGRLIAVGLKERGIALLDARNPTRKGTTLRDTGGEVKALAFSPDGKTLAAVTSAGLVTVWDVPSRSRRGEPFSTVGGWLLGLAFSADGRTLAVGGSTGVELWDALTRRRLAELGDSGSSSGVAVSADGSRVAAAVSLRGGATVWDMRTRSLVADVEGSSDADELAVALTGDGRLLAVGGYGTVVRLWDVGAEKLLHELEHKGAGATTLDFSSDGRVLAVSGFEPIASLWDVATGRQIGPNLTAGRRMGMVDLSSDGRRLLLTLANGEGAVWDIDPSSWARRACALANRTLTREEWERFLPGRPYEPACAT
jgi:WD40 repeat protein